MTRAENGRSVAWLAAAVLLAASSVFATDNAHAAPTETDLIALPFEQLLALEVRTASRIVQPRIEAPSVVSVITAAEIKAYGHRTLGDILRSLPGLWVTYDRNYQYLGTRGFGRPGDYNTRLLLLIDGHRMNDNIYDGGLIDRAFPLDVDLIERVEFAPGPGSAVYGSNAVFGVVNVITRTGGSIAGTEAALALGDAGARSARISHGRRGDGGLDVLISASGFRADGRDLYYAEFDDPLTNNGVAQDLDHERARSVLLKLRQGDYTFELAHGRRKKGIPTASYEQAFNDPRSHTWDNQSFASLQYDHAYGGSLEVQARLFYGYYDYFADYTYDYPPPTINRDESYGRWWGGEFRISQRVAATHRLVYGAEVQRDERRDQYNFDVDPYVSYLADRRSGRRAGVYLKDEIALRGDVTLDLGVRHDWYTDEDSATNPRLALIYRASPETVFKGMYGTAYRTPNAYERYYGAIGGYYKVNPQIGPEKVTTTELAVERLFGQQARMSASVFQYRARDLITLMTDPNDGLLFFDNVDKVKGRGLELQGERLWDSGWRVRAAWTVQRAEDEVTSAEPVNSPRHLGKLNFIAPLTARWRAGFEAQYTGARHTKAAEAGAVTVANLTFTAHEVVRGLELSFGIYNLFDRQYADPASEEHAQDAISQDGRGWRAKIGYKF